MLKVVVPVEDEILRAAERRKSTGAGEGISEFLSELINLGFEHRLQELYERFEGEEISLGYFADEMGMGTRDLYAALEERGLPTSNIEAGLSFVGS